MNQVTMRHPKLDEPITVPESAVPIHMASGWVPVESAGEQADEPTEETPPAAPAATRPKASATAKEKE